MCYTQVKQREKEEEMVTESFDNNRQGIPAHLLDILAGLQRQREELGSVADELIDLFRAHGVSLPPDVPGEKTLNP